MTHELWTGLNKHIYSYLEAVSLAELVLQQRATPADNKVSIVKDKRIANAAAA